MICDRTQQPIGQFSLDAETHPRARAIAFYLPQFHPIPENDRQWGKGFTEWTNVTRARPLFRGHLQPKLPGELGFYDLRVPEVREQQAELARYAGIEGFCYWHYWFGSGRTVLGDILSEVVRLKRPNYPFCVGWANESWTGRWHGLDSQLMIEQTYPGHTDHIAHFYHLLPAFADERYILVENRRLFIIYKPELHTDIRGFMDDWNELAILNGLNGFFFVSVTHPHESAVARQLDGYTRRNLSGIVDRLYHQSLPAKVLRMLHRLSLAPPTVSRCTYKELTELWDEQEIEGHEFPCVIPNWDNTPRCGVRGYALTESTPDLFFSHFQRQIARVLHRPFELRLIFIKSWNEWAEGNYLEPDQQYDRGYLSCSRRALLSTE